MEARLCVLVLAVLLVPSPAPAGEGEKAQHERNDLLTGYELIGQSLDAEAHLKYLLWLRELTLQGPAKEIERLMAMIYEASARRSDELEKLRKLSPAVTEKPWPSPFGDAIQESAQWRGTKEMLFPDGKFGIRFLFLQAQATRMVTVIAEQTAKIDPNTERQKWLGEVAKQFDDYREQLVKSVAGCQLQ